MESSSPLMQEEKHKRGGQYIKSAIYGGLDGIVSVFVAVAAASGSNFTIGIALILGLAKLFAGGISMGVGDWLATDAEVDMAKRERKREEWECDNYMEGEVTEMVELYVKKGVPRENAEKIIEILSKHKKPFVDIMMAEELGIPPDSEFEIPWKHGVTNFGSFMVFGVVPLLAYVIVVGLQSVYNFNGSVAFYVSISMTVLTLFGMGFAKAKLTGSSTIKSAAVTVIFGSFTAFVGWFVGWILNYSFPAVNFSQSQ